MINRSIIIAEAGVNHNGDLETALKLVQVAAEAQADFVKFQTFIPEKLVAPGTSTAPYQKEQTSQSDQLMMLKNLALTKEEHHILKKRCDSLGIGFLSTPFDMESANFLRPLVPFFKVPSGELTNLPYLQELSTLGLPMVVSTGMATLVEVAEAVEAIKKIQSSISLPPYTGFSGPLTLLHCTTAYPTPTREVNLLAIPTMQREFGLPIGYSDHTLNEDVPIAARALGATIIEKHFTLSREQSGPDHHASLEPDELKRLVQRVRSLEQALGDGLKRPTASEQLNIFPARKSLHFARSLKMGHVLQNEDIIVCRPARGLAPKHLERVVNSPLIRDIEAFEPVTDLCIG